MIQAARFHELRFIQQRSLCPARMYVYSTYVLLEHLLGHFLGKSHGFRRLTFNSKMWCFFFHSRVEVHCLRKQHHTRTQPRPKLLLSNRNK